MRRYKRDVKSNKKLTFEAYEIQYGCSDVTPIHFLLNEH